MKITSEKEYYKARYEFEELHEKAMIPNADPELPTLTTPEQNKVKELIEAIKEWDEEQEKEELIELTTVDWIEATDRADMIMNIIELLRIHPAIYQTPEIKEKVNQAQELLGDVYQACGEKVDEDMNEETTETAEEEPEVV